MYLKVIKTIALAMAILLSPSLFAQNNDGCFTLAIEDVNGAPGEQVCVDFTVENMNNIVAMQATITWDPDLLSFASAGSFNLPGFSAGNLGNADQANGRLPFVWVDPNVTGISRADGTHIFSLCFNIVGQLGANGAPISIGNNPTPIEAVNGAGNLVFLNVVPGEVNILSEVDHNLRAVVVCVDTSSCLIQVDNGAELVVTGGVAPYSYSWTGPGGFAYNQQDLPSSTPAGVYYVTVTDSQGHTAQGRTLHDGPEVLITAISADTLICIGSPLQLSVSTIDEASVAWAQVGSLSCLDCPNPFVDPSVYTIYNVTATTPDGCAESRSVVVDVRSYEDFGLLPFSNSPICEGDTLTFLSFIFNAQSYSWTGPNDFSSNAPFLVLPDAQVEWSGTYYLDIIDNIGCQVGASVTVAVVAPPVLEGQVTASNCSYEATGAINLTVSGSEGPYNYAWSHFFTGEDPSDLFPGTYQVTVSNALGCHSSASFEVGPDPIIANVASLVPVCPNDTPGLVITSVSGGSGEPYFYSIDGGITQLPVTQEPINIDTFNWTGLLIYDANGCIHAPVVAIIVPPPPFVIFSNEEVQPICPGSNSGAIGVQVFGATQPILYNWSNGEMLDTNWVYGLSDGNHTLTIEDANGCIQEASFFLEADLGQCEFTSDFEILVGESNQFCTSAIDANELLINAVSCNMSPASFDYTISADQLCFDFIGAALGADTICLQLCRPNDPNACITAVLNVQVVMEVGTQEPEWAQQLRVYPNPATDRLLVSSPNAINWQSVQLFDARAQYIGTWAGKAIQEGLSVEQLPAGVYFIRLYAEEGMVIRRWVKQ